LGRYRPALFRKDMADGFRLTPALTWPRSWSRWSSPEERLLDTLDLAGKVVYDIGAHSGAYTLFFSRRVGETGWVVAFEPQPRNFARLLHNLHLNHVVNAQPLRLGLGANSEVRDLYMLPGMSTTASMADESRTPLRRHAGSAQLERLDTLVERMPLPPPDFLKIDVEGLELEVLHGALRTLHRYRPGILVEVHGASREQKAARVRSLTALLQRLGYSLIHAESGQAVTAQSAPATGHVYARQAA